MSTCNSCGNDQGKIFTVTYAGKSYHFDCFECAIHTLAPPCQTCGCKILGHGIENSENYFCCSHCLQKAMENANAKIPQA